MRTHHTGRIREHLEAIHRGMQDHGRVWEAEKARTGSNAKAYEAARGHWMGLRDHWNAMMELLPDWAALEAGEAEAVEGWLAFCEIDVPAFRAGYLKEKVYRRLGRAPHSKAQRQRILALALHHAQAPQWRREMGSLAALAAKVADASFVDALQALWRQAADPRDRLKRGLTLSKVLHLRPELRPSTPMDLKDLDREVDALRRAHWEARLTRIKR